MFRNTYRVIALFGVAGAALGSTAAMATGYTYITSCNATTCSVYECEEGQTDLDQCSVVLTWPRGREVSED
jgi:hypothetical protein